MIKYTTLPGGSDDDTYYVDSSTQKVVEYAGGGIDTVVASVTFDVGEQEIEILKGLAKSQGLHLTGNQYTQEIWGSAGHDVLSDGGHADALTTMIGGLGNDTYIVSSHDVVVIEDAGSAAGFDTIKTNLDWYDLPDNVEVLRYTGSDSFEGYGNDLNNALYGGAADDTLDGGAGSDLMFGGAGNDFYFYSDVGDFAFEAEGGGSDAIGTNLTVAKAAANVEFLIYYGEGEFTGFANDTGTMIIAGYSSGALWGGAGTDILVAGFGPSTMNGGAGNDVLVSGFSSSQMTGGAGSDVFAFTTHWTGTARITDFQHGVDVVSILSEEFGGVDHLGTSTNSAMMVYESGALYYDPTGSASTSDRMILATFDNNPTLTSGDFFFI
ncbi:hypothetical protein BH10PSE3_BH10PSE3_09300 [soil metagenome]